MAERPTSGERLLAQDEFFDAENLVRDQFATLPYPLLGAVDAGVARRWLTANADVVRMVVQRNALDVALCGAVGALLRKFHADESDVKIQWVDRREMSRVCEDSGLLLGEQEPCFLFARACREFFDPGEFWRPRQRHAFFVPEVSRRMIRVELLETLMLVANLETLLRFCLAASGDEGWHEEMTELCGVVCDKLASMARPRESQVRKVGYFL